MQRALLLALGTCALLAVSLVAPSAGATPTERTLSTTYATVAGIFPGAGASQFGVAINPNTVVTRVGDQTTVQTYVAFFVNLLSDPCVLAATGVQVIGPADFTLDAPYKSAHLRATLTAPNECGDGDIHVDVDVSWESGGVAHSYRGQTGENVDKMLGTASGVITFDSATSGRHTVNLDSVQWSTDVDSYPLAWIAFAANP